MLIRTKIAAQELGLSPNTLRKMADTGEIPHVRTNSGQRLYDISAYIQKKGVPRLICYCRVSSAKQKDALARQVQYMRQKFANAEIVQDVGSGLNFKRKGLVALLESAMRGEKLSLVVAHRDRLARFGFDLIKYVIERSGGSVMVLDDTTQSPESELVADLVSIINVFACRINGLRSYGDKIKKDPSLP